MSKKTIKKIPIPELLSKDEYKNKYNKAYTTLTEMMDARNVEFKSLDDEKIVFENIFVFFCSDGLSKGTLKEYLDTAQEHDIQHILIVYDKSITSNANAMLAHILNIYIETFSLIELQINITKHRLVPKHSKISDETKSELSSFDVFKFPKLLRKDPISRFYNFKPGNVIKIERANGIVCYRVVV